MGIKELHQGQDGNGVIVRPLGLQARGAGFQVQGCDSASAKPNPNPNQEEQMAG